MSNDIAAEEVTDDEGNIRLSRLAGELSGEQIVEFLSDAVNPGVNGSEVRDSVSKQHRYLQSEIHNSVVKQIIIGMAANGTDARNEKAVNECREICEALGWDYEEVPFPQ